VVGAVVVALTSGSPRAAGRFSGHLDRRHCNGPERIGTEGEFDGANSLYRSIALRIAPE